MTNTNEHLKRIFENIQQLEHKKSVITEEIKDIKKEAKSSGFDIKIINKLLKAASNPDKFKEEMEMLEIYSDNVQLDLFK